MFWPYAEDFSSGVTVTALAVILAVTLSGSGGASGGGKELAEATKEVVTQAQDTPTEGISLPLTGNTANSLRNLVTKATSGYFSCLLAQVDALKNRLTVESVREQIAPDLTGLAIADTTITLTGASEKCSSHCECVCLFCPEKQDSQSNCIEC